MITVWKDDRQAAEDFRVVRFYPRISAPGLGRIN